MAFSCSTSGFPKIRSYESARKHFDSVTPWRSWRFNPDGDERPIGDRTVKHNDGRQYNKAMRELADGSIAFRLFDTDCVVWHPNGELTITGYATMSTTAFVNSLTPGGIIHGQGAKGMDEPILHLTQVIEHVSPATEWSDEYQWKGPDWISGMIIQCDCGVRLRHCSKNNVWTPTKPDELRAFSVPQVDHKAARQVSKQYNLPTLQHTLNAIMALHAPPPPAATWAQGSVRYGEIMDALERAKYMEAVALFPRGDVKVFGREHGTPNGIRPGFMRELREHIYNHEGVVSRIEKRMLTPAQYKRYVRDTNRFF